MMIFRQHNAYIGDAKLQKAGALTEKWDDDFQFV